MRAPSLLLLALAPGCVIVYGASAPAPGLMRPSTDAAEGEVFATVGVARNVADGIDVSADGTATPTAQDARIWPNLDVGVRQSLGKGVGLEARLTGSVIVPLPLPVPQGFSLAPVFKVYQPDATFRIDLSPRFVRSGGFVFLAVSNDDKAELHTQGWGAELPVMFSWQPDPDVSLNATPYVRGFLVRGRLDVDDVEGRPVWWPTVSTGLTLNGLLDVGPARLGLGGGVELVPEVGAGLPCPEGCTRGGRLVAVPQIQVSFAGAWP